MFFRFHKPEWLYELLPWLYIVVGLLTMLLLRNLMSVFSGLMLISAGFNVWLMRRRNRKSPSADLAKPSRSASSQPGASGVMQLIWRSSYECGDPLIDQQHQELFELGNELVNALLNGDPKIEVELRIDAFVEHIVDHFKTEEALMVKAGDPVEAAHLHVHHQLLARAKELNRRFHKASGDRVVRDLVSFISYDVVAQHLIQEDPKMMHVALGRNS